MSMNSSRDRNRSTFSLTSSKSVQTFSYLSQSALAWGETKASPAGTQLGNRTILVWGTPIRSSERAVPQRDEPLNPGPSSTISTKRDGSALI